MNPTRKIALAALVLGLGGAGALSVASLASASGTGTAATATTVVTTDDGSSSTSDSSGAPTDPAAGTDDAAPDAQRPAEEELTGDTAASVEAAVTAAYPDATIDRMEADADGATYEAHITLADGSQATVKLDASFAITGTETGGPGGHGGGQGGDQGRGHGPHAANGITEVELTGDAASSVEAAVTAAYPDATIDRMETDAEGAAYEAHITNADGSRSTVKLDASFAVTSTESGMA